MRERGVVHGLMLVFGLVMLSACLGCGKNSQQTMVAKGDALMETTPSPDTTDQKLAAEPAGGGTPVTTVPQKLIRTSSLQLEVKDFDAAAASLSQLAKAMGGYVADTQVTRHASGYRSGQIALKIPAERFDAAGTSIRAVGKVLAERSTLEDVTKAYTDRGVIDCGRIYNIPNNYISNFFNSIVGVNCSGTL